MTMTLMLINRTIITIAVQAPPIRILEYKSLTLTNRDACNKIYYTVTLLLLLLLYKGH